MSTSKPSRTTGGLAILLPPSEGKATGGSSPKWSVGSGNFGRQLGPSRRAIVEHLNALNGGDSRLLGVSGAHLDRARDANSHLIGAPTRPAWQRYTGVVWDHLDPTTLSHSARVRAEESIIVFSGLLGLVGFTDRIPDYKLKMGASLPEIGKLSTWWRPMLSAALNSWLQHRVVIDLLAQEQRHAWLPDQNLHHRAVTFVNDTGRPVGHDAKAAKGLLVRHLLESKDAPEKALATWKHPQFTIDVS